MRWVGVGRGAWYDDGRDDEVTLADVSDSLTDEEAEDAQAEQDLRDLHATEDADIGRACRRAW